MEISVLSTKGQLTIPAKIREALKLEKGDLIFFNVIDLNQANIKVIKKPRLMELYGALPATRKLPKKSALRNLIGQELGKRSFDSRRK